MLSSKNNKFNLSQILLLCLQWGTPNKDYFTLEELRKKLKFQHINDYKKFRSCIDLLEDAEYAIINFFEYQLSTNRGKLNTGEKYLRLYGVLNAVYLQSQAILEIAEIVKYPQKRGIYQKFSSLNIYETRNIAGSHTVNFIPHKSIKFPTPNNEKNHFKVIFSELREDGRKMSVVDGFGKVEEFNLYEDIKEYCGLSELFLIEIVEKYITSLLRNDVGLRTEIKATINKIRNNKTDYRKIDKYKNYDRKIMRRAKKLIEKLKKSTSK